MSRDTRSDFDDQVALGNVEGVYSVNKYGRSTNVDAAATDIWDLTASQPIWLAPTASRIHAIVSASANDTAAGTGARTVQIYGLKDWDSKESSEVITMAGETPVNTENAYVIIHRMKVLTWSTAGPNAGIIKATAASDSTITAQILAGAGQTQMAIYGVPSTQTLLINKMYTSLLQASALTGLCDITLLYNPIPKTLTTKFLTKHSSGISAVGDSRSPDDFKPAKKFLGPGILKIQALGSAADLDVSAGFDGKLYDNTLQ